MDAVMQKFWDGKHAEGSPAYLSGNGEATLDILQIRELVDRLPPNASMLNIGIGLGKFEAFMRDKVARLDCMDVSANAAKVVEGVCSYFYHYPDHTPPPNTYDLITELLVAQHIDDEDLRRHILISVAALKPDGLYTLQAPDFYCEPTVEELLHNQDDNSKMSGSVRRPVCDIAGLVTACGGRIVKVGFRGMFPQYNSTWYVYHIVRQPE